MAEAPKEGGAPAAGGAAGEVDDVEAEAKKAKKKQEQKNKEDLKSFPDLYPKQQLDRIKMSEREKKQREYLRRWKIRINKIGIKNYADSFDPFVQINIGGNYTEQIRKNREMEMEKDIQGNKEAIFYTDTQTVDKNQTIYYQQKFIVEMDFTYQQIEDDFMVIEIWDHEGSHINLLKGYHRVSLEKIANGRIFQYINIQQYPLSLGRQLCQLEFQIVFQEIWDFSLIFQNWRIRQDISDQYPADINPMISFKFNTTQKNPQILFSDKKDAEADPSWSIIDGNLDFRGTVSDLELESILLELYNCIVFFMRKQIANVALPLSQITQSSNFLINLLIKQEESQKKQLNHKLNQCIHKIQQNKKEIKENKYAIEECEYTPKDTADEKEMKKQNKKKLEENNQLAERQLKKLELRKNMLTEQQTIRIKMQGSIDINTISAYKQSGSLREILKDEYYLCVHIGQLLTVSQEDTNPDKTFIGVTFGQTTDYTQTIDNQINPEFQKTLYFKLNYNLEGSDDPAIFKQNLMDFFKLNYTLKFDVYKYSEGFNESHGQAIFFLQEFEFVQEKTEQTFIYESGYELYYTTLMASCVKQIQTAVRKSTKQLDIKVWFMPKIPLDKEFSQLPDQIKIKYPKEINTVINQDQGLQQRYTEFFNTYIVNLISKFRIDNFDLIYMHNQYKKQFLLCNFIQKLAPPLLENDVNILDKKLWYSKHPPIFSNKVETINEIINWVHCFRLGKPNYIDSWTTPDQILFLRTGDMDDLVLFAASLIMGCVYENRKHYELKKSYESQLEYIQKNPDLELLITSNPFIIENRTFICIGIDRQTMETVSWVLIFSINLKDVYMWDVQNGQKYKLGFRVLEKERYELAKTILPSFPNYNEFVLALKNKKLSTFGNETLLDQWEKFLPMSKDDLLKIIKKDPNKKDKNLINLDLDFNKFRDIGQNFKKFGNIFESQGGGEKDKIYKQYLRNMKNKFIDNLEMEIQFHENLKDEQVKEVKQNFNQKSEYDQDNIIMNMKSEQENFFDDDENEYKDDLQDFPFKTIELIISNKNIFINIRNQDPTKIYYHLHDSNDWFPYIIYNEKIDKQNVRKIWNKPLPSIYEYKNVTPPLTIEEVQLLELQIFKSCQNELQMFRNSINASIKLRNHYEKVTELVGHYSIILENTECGRITQAQTAKLTNKWERRIKAIIPNNYIFNAIPFFFKSDASPQKISSLIIQSQKEFFSNKEKNQIFIISVRIFPLNHKINSIRILVVSLIQQKKEIQEDN